MTDTVEREDRAWLVARLHNSAHGTWLGPDECPFCLAYDSPHLNLTPWARDHLGAADALVIELRARSLNARVGALYSQRHHQWWTSASTPERTVKLKGSGPLAAVLAGVLDDLEALVA